MSLLGLDFFPALLWLSVRYMLANLFILLEVFEIVTEWTVPLHESGSTHLYRFKV